MRCFFILLLAVPNFAFSRYIETNASFVDVLMLPVYGILIYGLVRCVDYITNFFDWIGSLFKKK